MNIDNKRNAPHIARYKWFEDNWTGTDAAIIFYKIKLDYVNFYIPNNPNTTHKYKGIAIFDGQNTFFINLKRDVIQKVGPIALNKGSTFLRVISEYPEPELGKDRRAVGVILRPAGDLSEIQSFKIRDTDFRDFPLHPDAPVLSHAFDAEHYRQQLSNLHFPRDPFMHYIMLGWRLGYTPNRKLPRPTESDLTALLRTNVNPHVLEVLRTEKSSAPVEAPAATIPVASPLTGTDAANDALDALWRKHVTQDIYARRSNFRFDPAFYAQMYIDIRPMDPEDHYYRFGQKEGRARNHFALLQRSISNFKAKIGSVIHLPEFTALVEAENVEVHELAYELIALGHPIDMSMSNFSAHYYLKSYQDINISQLNPFIHFLSAGFDEGRRTLSELRSGVKLGHRAYDASLPTCIVCTHALSKTGAPIVAKSLVVGAVGRYNVVVLSLRSGFLEDEMREHAMIVATMSDPFHDYDYIKAVLPERIDFAILNSVECWSFVHLFVGKNVPIVSYIHEYRDYTRPSYKLYFTCWFSDHVAFSSDSVRSSWGPVFKECGFDWRRDSTVIPQRFFLEGGAEPDEYQAAREQIQAVLPVCIENKSIVYGAGEVQIRKGVDIFVMVSQQVKAVTSEVVFVWIGDGLNRDDIAYGVWLDKHMREAELAPGEPNLFFLPAGDSYPHLCKAADVLFMPSRMDPLPNIVFDAAASGAAIILFEGASGFDDEIYCKTSLLRPVPYGRLDLAAQAILSAPRKTRRTSGLFSTAAATVAPKAISEDEGQQRIFVSLCKALVRPSPPLLTSADDFDVSTLFNGDKENGEFRKREREKARRFGRKLIWSSLDEARNVLRTEGGWVHERSQIIADDKTREHKGPSSYNLHYHAFYIDGAVEEIADLKAVREARRVVFTTDSERKREALAKAAEEAGLRCEILLVKNRGRDILPFLHLFDDLGEETDDEVWCHLHHKKSVGSATTGDMWRKFLLDTLLGSPTGLSAAVEKIADSEVGLVTAFDPYIIGWGFSERLLPSLRDRLPAPLEQHPLLFPVGNMFWTKGGVVRRLRALVGRSYPWPNEPIENDGTIFHLIERLWPTAATLAGLKSVFVHKPDQRRA